MSTSPRTTESDVITASPAAALETAVCEVAGVVTRTQDGTVFLSGEVSLTVGTAGTAVTATIRRGAGTAGSIVAQTGPNTAVATDAYTIAVDGEDSPGLVDGETYTLTVTVAAATAASVVHQAALRATY